MKRLIIDDGGRPLRNDDLLVLDLHASIFEAFCEGIGGGTDFVISGCTQNGADVDPGYAYIAGKIRRFDGATGVTLTASSQLQADADVDYDSRTYEDASSSNTIKEQKATLV